MNYSCQSAASEKKEKKRVEKKEKKRGGGVYSEAKKGKSDVSYTLRWENRAAGTSKTLFANLAFSQNGSNWYYSGHDGCGFNAIAVLTWV